MSTSLSIFIAKTEGKAKVKNRLIAQSAFPLDISKPLESEGASINLTLPCHSSIIDSLQWK